MSLQAFLREASAQRLLQSAHDLSDGGMAVALAECCLAGGFGARVNWKHTDRASTARFLFGECTATAIVSFSPDKEEAVSRLMKQFRLSAGGGITIGGDRLEITNAQSLLSLSLDELRDAYEGAIPRAMGQV